MPTVAKIVDVFSCIIYSTIYIYYISYTTLTPLLFKVHTFLEIIINKKVQLTKFS